MSAPAKNSKWLDVVPPAFCKDAEKLVVRVMGVVENHVVARRIGAAPFLTPVKQWHKKFKPATRPEEPN